MYVNSAAAPAMLPRVRNLQRPARPRLILAKSTRRANCSAPPAWQPTLVRRGVGALDPQQSQIANIAAQGASLASGSLVALGAIGGPVGVAIGGIITLGLQLANVFSGCGDTCVEATHIADQVGALLTQMFNTYMSSPVHYKSMQTAYLQQWDAAWNALQKACSNTSLGDAGVRCITDRQRGACHYQDPAGAWVQDSTGKWSFDGSAGPNCWNWFTGSRDPVANDPTVVDDPTPASSVTSAASSVLNSISSLGLSTGTLMLGGAVILGLFIFMGDGK